MPARPDDDALAWDSDDDPTLDVGSPVATGGSSLPEGFTAVGKDSETVGKDADTVGRTSETVTTASDAGAELHERQPLGNAALVTLGILGGFYLLFTIGWVIGGFRLQGRAQYLFADVMFQGSFWLAALAPALWFGSVFLLTRRSAVWVRIVWLVAGAILLVPWPFIMVGTVGQ
ncbi:DNA polymerase III subunit gamma/tau [Microbacterium deminutum]|uniref:DNA polymerase III subunit gamma/tau n=1 Tax=Microbacterium deminutum TaxID=344164 RepID=A0ABP5CAN8_9MICO